MGYRHSPFDEFRRPELCGEFMAQLSRSPCLMRTWRNAGDNVTCIPSTWLADWFLYHQDSKTQKKMDWPNKPASIDLAVIFEFCDKNVSKCLKHGGLQIISSLFNVYSMSIQCLSKVYPMSQYLQISHGYHWLATPVAKLEGLKSLVFSVHLGRSRCTWHSQWSQLVEHPKIRQCHDIWVFHFP